MDSYFSWNSYISNSWDNFNYILRYKKKKRKKDIKIDINEPLIKAE